MRSDIDVGEEMRAVEAEVGGRVGEAVSGVRARAGRLGRIGAVLKSGLRAVLSRVAGLGVVALVAGGLVLVAACASPLAVWSAYHAGAAVAKEKARADDAEAVARTATHDKAVVEKASKRLATTDEADRKEIRRLHAIADRLSHRPAAKPLCPTTVFDVLHGAGYSPTPGHE